MIAKRKWSDGSFVAGQQYEFDWDLIGGRTKARQGGTGSGSGLRESIYIANALNQYTSGQSGRVKLDGSSWERITPVDVDAFTPRLSADGKWPVAAISRCQHRQIERLRVSHARAIITAVTKDAADHWNPSISADGQHILYHKTEPGFISPEHETRPHSVDRHESRGQETAAA